MSQIQIEPATTSPRPRLSAKDTFASLRHPNYRLWFFGQMVSLIGTWMQSTAQGFLMYELTRSPTYLGYIGFAAGVPTWIFMLYGGLIADRMPRRTLLVITQTSMMLLAFLIAGLTFSGLIQPWHIILIAFCLGIANAFDAPARQAFILEMVSREDLPNAIALNSTMFNLGTSVGPAAGGMIYALVGPAWCFTINAISFLAVIAALLLMKLKQIPQQVWQSSALQEIRSGIHYVATQSVVRTIVINLGIVSLFGMGFVTLMPAWAVKILGGDATTNGLLQSARGIGAFIGALMTAALSRHMMRGKLSTIGNITLPLFLLIFAALRWLPLSLLGLVFIGWAFQTYINNANSLVQTEVPDELRGRVMSIYTLTFFGLMPIGSLLAGTVATHIGEPQTVFLGSCVVLAVALFVFWRVPKLRQMQ
jgi:MFS family permease